MNENKVRKVILTVLCIGILIALALRFSIAAPDTKSKIAKQMSIARELIHGDDVGNANGQFSLYTANLLKAEMEKVNTVLDNEKSTEEEEKQALKEIQASIETFKKSSNKNSLSADEIKKLVKEKKTYSKEVKLDEKVKVEWEIPAVSIQEAEPVNLDVSRTGINTPEIQKQFEKQKTERQILALRHNGEFPCQVKLHIKGITDGKGSYVAYFYDTKKKTVSKLDSVTVKDKEIVLTVTQGGDYVILPDVETGTGDGEAAAPATVAPAPDAQGNPADTSQTQTPQQPSAGNKNKKGDGNEVTTTTTYEDGEGEGAAGEDGDSHSGDSSGTNTPSGGTSNTQQPSDGEGQEPQPEEKTCILEIHCETILDNMDDLRDGLEYYVPSDGLLLDSAQVTLTEGETVFDVLKRVTRNRGIKLEFRNDAVHGAGYIVGIGNLNEFDCGSGSGWMYMVNGWYPNYGCADYTVENGDIIQWFYTCDLGRDIGGNFWE